MRNYRPWDLGQNPFSIFRSGGDEGGEPVIVPDEGSASSGSIFSILRPSEGSQRKGNLFFSDADSLPEVPGGGGDPFTAASQSQRAPQKRSFKGRPGGPSGEGWKPYPRMREGYSMPASLSGPGPGTSIFQDPVFWVIAGTGLFLALEASGVTGLYRKL